MSSVYEQKNNNTNTIIASETLCISGIKDCCLTINGHKYSNKLINLDIGITKYPKNYKYKDNKEVILGFQWKPINSIGVYVPGGTASYPSSILMSSIPAKIAGVKKIVMVIPQKNTNKLKDKIFGIECNFEELNAIDFKKGCYVGQENTSRIKLKNKLTKRLLPIKIIEGNISEGDIIFNKDTEIGKVLIGQNYPFAVIKYTSEKFDFNSIFKINNAKVKIIKPNWL